MGFPDKELLKDLIDGKITDQSIIRRVMSEPKDPDRFQKYIEILQEKVKWKEPIIMPLGLHLYIVQKDHELIVKCDCGHEFGDYRANWKLNSILYVRDSEDKLDEIFPGPRKGVNPQLYELREFYCPSCGTMLEIESVPPGYPIAFDFLPDIEAFYQTWLGKPLECKQAYEDITDRVIEAWAQEE